MGARRRAWTTFIRWYCYSATFGAGTITRKFVVTAFCLSLYCRFNIPRRRHTSQLACHRTLCCTLGSEIGQSAHSPHAATENRQNNQRSNKNNHCSDHNKNCCRKGFHRIILVEVVNIYLQPLATAAQSLQPGSVAAQLCGVPPATLTVSEFHVAGGHAVLPLAVHVICALLKHRLSACVIVATFCIPLPKIVSITRAATRITTAVTTIRMVVERPFIQYNM